MQFQSYRTHDLGSVNESLIDQTITLCGFVDRRRDHGDVIFIDLRDRYGIAQCVIAPDISAEAREIAWPVRKEWVLSVTGKLVLRAGGINENLPSGRVELQVSNCTVLSQAETTPFFITEDTDADESTRLQYRYLDLRRPSMVRNMELRHRVVKIMRDYLDNLGFLEIETPMLCRSTPEGARDFLVPSRMNAERFYALPQSPQIYKQILMVAGMDRYFQVARCFRDEDLRGDRQPEFTQVDIEVSFATSDDIIRMIEGMVEEIYAQAMDKKITLPLQRMTYAEGMERFGNDKPDTRFGMEIVDATDLMGGTEFGVANSVIEAGGRIRGIAVPDVFSRKQMKDLESMIATFGAKGIMFIKREADGYKSPLTRFYSDEQLTAIMERFGAEEETILLVAGPDKITCPSLSRLRLHLGEACGLIDHNRHDFLWIVDPPLVEFNDDTNSYDPVHHPFTAPLAEDLAKMDTDLASVRADAYDLVLNGNEVAGGSVRIHSRELQKTVFSSIGLDMAAIEEKFGFMLEAFRYGVPPHAGIAYGLDRLLMIMTNTSSIREVMAFPKTTSGGCLMTAAPSFVDNDQLKDLHIRTCGTEKSETSS